MANAFILVVIMIKGKSLYDGFSCFNHNEAKNEWIRCSAVLIIQRL